MSASLQWLWQAAFGARSATSPLRTRAWLQSLVGSVQRFLIHLQSQWELFCQGAPRGKRKTLNIQNSNLLRILLPYHTKPRYHFDH